ncbi:MAG: LPS export ABC transporter periplasmic protein LptC [Gemmatimonadales bacterium]
MRKALLLAIALLCACKEEKGPPIAANTKSIADSADQVLYGQRMLITDRGLNRAEILSDTAYFFDENTRTEMRVVRGTFFDAQGKTDAILTSRTGLFNQRLNSLEARGDVVITTIDGRHLETPFVRYDQRVNLVSSDSVFTLTTEDGRVLHGIGFTTDPDLNSVHIVKTLSARAGAVVIPKE